jgi:hypothetical protein
MPVTSDARSIAAAAMAPAVAFRNPDRLPIESEPKNPDVDDAFVAERLVVEAVVIVAFDASKATKWDVEDAKMPFCAHIGDVVAAERTL